MGAAFGMSAATDFVDFLPRFFELFSGKSFRGGDYLNYLARPVDQRTGDEAPIVDTAIVGPLLGLLGFEPAERDYNHQRPNGRPDFAPQEALYGICFIVEDKSTALSLDVDLTNPESPLSQLLGYMRSANVRLGWLTNGRQLTVWRSETSNQPARILDIDLATAITEWRRNDPPVLSEALESSLRSLFDFCRKASFTDPQRLEKEIATDLNEWAFHALPLGKDSQNQSTLVGSLQSLVQELQSDARRILNRHLERHTEYSDKAKRLTDISPEVASQELRSLRNKVISILREQFQLVWRLEEEDILAIQDILTRLEQGTQLFASPREVLQEILEIVNNARRRKPSAKAGEGRPIKTLEEFPALYSSLKTYVDKGFSWHYRQATLRHDYREDLSVYEDYVSWRELVRETMLGELDEDRRRNEFALQAAYVVFIRLLLIRVCEDKGVLPYRFISDGGIKHWQEDIQRYHIFAQGNPYSPLLNMAYDNAQNIYAHFFTGRELFNWYRLDKKRFIMTLYQLSRFNFADVDSDIIGTIYNTYVNREEKRNKGQYYTPPEIIHYILDTVGYEGRNIIGSNKRLIDPACGSGSFLVTAAKRLVKAYQGTREQVDNPIAVLERVQQNLFGFDLNPFACYLAEINLLIQVLDLVKKALAVDKSFRLKPFHIYNVDALARPGGTYYYLNINMLLAEENDQVNQIKSRAADTPYAQGFAFVVANPPYGATLSDSYKKMLRENWADVFYGQPDTYTFFLKLGLDLLANNGKLGFITPNTYLMGTHTAILRNKILTAGRVEQVVDLPQGIWPDANVDCVLLFLSAENDEEKRKSQQVHIYMLGLRDSLDKLTGRAWSETFVQPQSRWLANARNEITIRHDTLLQQIEDVCHIPVNDNGGFAKKVQRLNDVTESTQGIIPYHSKAEGKANLYIKPRRSVPPDEPDWKPLLDSAGFIGRYELRWGKEQPYLKYGNWLYSVPRAKFFESPKLLVQDMRNRALKRRLVATYDDQKFYNRHNFSDIIAKDPHYDLKYILALFNSSLLNYWFARQFDNLHINPSYFRQLPIYPADATTQAQFVALVDEMLARHASLNGYREEGYTIRLRRDSIPFIDVPYDALLNELQAADRNFPVLTLYDARALDLFAIPERCDLQATISGNVYNPERYPTSVVLRHNKLWLEVPEEEVRRYLLRYLGCPRWRGKTWDEIRNTALIPEDAASLSLLFAAETQKIETIQTLLDEIKRIDAEIDERVLDLYGITDAADRQRVLGSAPVEEEEAGDTDDEVTS